MSPKIASSSIYFDQLSQSAAFTACPWFFSYANDSAVVDIQKNVCMLVNTRMPAGKHLLKPTRKNDLSDDICFYSKINDSAVFKRTH
jgi:hypothetical protein